MNDRVSRSVGQADKATTASVDDGGLELVVLVAVTETMLDGSVAEALGVPLPLETCTVAFKERHSLTLGSLLQLCESLLLTPLLRALEKVDSDSGCSDLSVGDRLMACVSRGQLLIGQDVEAVYLVLEECARRMRGGSSIAGVSVMQEGPSVVIRVGQDL